VLAVILNCLIPESNRLPHRQLIVQVTDKELYMIVTLLLGCLQIKQADKKVSLCFPQWSLSSSLDLLFLRSENEQAP